MIQKDALLADLQQLLKELVDDLRERVQQKPELNARLLKQYQEAREAQRTAQAYEEWREEPITQAAAAWILAAVFVRFLEDNDLVETPRLSGPGERLRLARDHQTLYFQKHPSETDREYIEFVFRDVAQLPALRELFDEQHNPVWSIAPSGDGAKRILDIVQRIDPTTGVLVHDFTDPEWNTRFLGDLYQDLSEAARKKYALLQTPEFIEEFILDRTLDPAINEFGYREVRLIDPTCGSGHLLLGAFRRLFGLWQRHDPATNTRELAQRALNGVYGVDLNPFAVAIARFRLLVAALRSCGITRLKDAPGFKIHLATGDSLLHGPRFAAISGVQATLDPAEDPLRHVYATEDREALGRILGQRYHAVVGNPPYITVDDKALNQAYRLRYGSCHGKYSLAVPFMERFFELALAESDGQAAGFVGEITANSFMKREFGKKLIHAFIPRWDLTHAIDVAGAYIPGHGIPTVILFGRNRMPVAGKVRVVMGIRGEPATPSDPTRGLVWSAVVAQVDQPGSQSEYISVSDTARASLQKHPWSIGGGGASELKELLEDRVEKTLEMLADSVGITAFTLEDDLYLVSAPAARRHRLPLEAVREMVVGDAIRDWAITACDVTVFPYNNDFEPLAEDRSAAWFKYMWPARSSLARSKMFGDKSKVEAGLRWYEFGRLTADKLRSPLSITFAFVATHNHFIFDRGGRVFNRSAPVIKLPEKTTEDKYLGLVGLLNSSTACFWMKQVFHNKGSTIDDAGARQTTVGFENFYEFTATGLGGCPIPDSLPVELGRLLDSIGRAMPSIIEAGPMPTFASLGVRKQQWKERSLRLVALQEELDWDCYRRHGLVDEALNLLPDQVPGICPGERAFEIVLARKMAAGELQTSWFERHGSTPITEIPSHWPEDYRRLVERRVAVIESKPDIRLIEQPEYKRRWNVEPWESQQERALRSWLLDRLESPSYWPSVELQTCARLADRAHKDAEFMQVAELYRDRADFDVAALISELVEAEAVPFLPVLRYKESGLRKRALWENTWDLQRREDAIDARVSLPDDPVKSAAAEAERDRLKKAEVGNIAIPPRYTSADFLSGFWRLRGKLDVPKERFVSYPHCERDADRSLVITWAGWDHLQEAQALAGYYVAMKDKEGWSVERLTPLLAGLLNLLPWLEQWHNDIDPAFGIGMGEYFRRFVDEESRARDLTADAIRAWRPIMTIRKKRARG